MQGRRVNRFGIAAVAAATVIGLVTTPAAATDGWLDPTFSGDGWVQLEAGNGGPIDLVAAAGPSGSTVVGREFLRDEAAIVEALVISSSGVPVSTFNRGEWRWMIDATDSATMAGFAATPDGGAIAAHGTDASGTYRIRMVDAGGDFVGSGGGDLNGTTTANLVRLPGGSLRTCFDDAFGEQRLLGFTAALALDPAVGPGGQRDVPIECTAVGSNTSGHLYLANSSGPSATGRLELMRTTTSGTVDAGWSGDGTAIVARAGLGIDFPDEEIASAPDFNAAASPIIPLPDGSLLIAARVTRDPTAESWSAAVIKLAPDGRLDATFDGDGIRAFGPEGGQSWILAMGADSAGRAVVSVAYDAPTGRKAYLTRFTHDGRFDGTFGHGGQIQQTYGASSVSIDAAGRIVTAAWNGEAVVLARREG